MHNEQFLPVAYDAIEAPRRARARHLARLEVGWASHADEVIQAQRLRYQVFVEEMGARLSVPPGTPDGLDIDRYDAACEHLIVRTVESAHAPAEVVGTYRVLTPDAARRVGGFYTETEFDLRRLAPLRTRMAEIGRSCTARPWRDGPVIMLLWSSLGGFLVRNRLDMMIGCASVPMRDGGHYAASLWNRLRQMHLADPDRMVLPRLPLPVDDLDGSLEVEAPPLIKGYLKCGARVLGAPAWDPEFGVADLPMMIDLADLPTSYRKRFLSG